MTLYKLLKLDKLKCSVAIIQRASSTKMGKKDIIKIDADMDIDMDILGYVDPGATINIIHDGTLVEKRATGLPQRLTNILFCKNPRCISSTEQELPHVFRLTDVENRVYRCVYCDVRAK